MLTNMQYIIMPLSAIYAETGEGSESTL